MDIDQKSRDLALRAIHLVEDIAIIVIFVRRLMHVRPVFRKDETTGGFRAEFGRIEPRFRISERGTLCIVRPRRGSVRKIVPTAIIVILDPAKGFAQRGKRELFVIIGPRKIP